MRFLILSIVGGATLFEILIAGDILKPVFGDIISYFLPLLLIVATISFKSIGLQKQAIITTIALCLLTAGNGLVKSKKILESGKPTKKEELKECPGSVTDKNCVYNITQCVEKDFYKQYLCGVDRQNTCTFTDQKALDRCNLRRKNDLAGLEKQNNEIKAFNSKIDSLPTSGSNWMTAILILITVSILPFLNLFFSDWLIKSFTSEGFQSKEKVKLKLNEVVAEKRSLQESVKNLRKDLEEIKRDNLSLLIDNSELKKQGKVFKTTYIRYLFLRERIFKEPVEIETLSKRLEVSKAYLYGIRKEVLGEFKEENTKEFKKLSLVKPEKMGKIG
jgi:hypothetical protein